MQQRKDYPGLHKDPRCTHKVNNSIAFMREENTAEASL